MNDFQRTVAVRLGVAIAVVVVALVLPFQAFAQTPPHPVDTHEVAQPAAPPTLGEQIDAEAAKLREKLDRVAAAGETATEMGEAAGTAIASLREDVSTKIKGLRDEYRQLQTGIMAFLQEVGEDRKLIAELGDRADKLAADNEAMRIAIQSYTEQLANLRAELAAQHTPTAAELSQPGALQEYVDAHPECRLPGGVIEISEANPLKIYRRQGGSIIGSGKAYTTHDQQSGWNKPGVDHSTRLVSIDGTGVEMVSALNFTLADFAIESANIGILHTNEKGWGSAYNTLERVSFIGCKVAMQCGESQGDHNAADIVFRTCLWRDNEVGFRVMHDQGVNYLFDGLCKFQRNDLMIDLVRGGRLVVRDAMGMGGKVFIRTGTGSSGQLIVDRLAWDRKLPGFSDWHDPLPILFDGRKSVSSQLDVEFSRISVNAKQWQDNGKWRREGDDGEHRFFYMPKHAEGRSWQTGDFERVHGNADKVCSQVVYE